MFLANFDVYDNAGAKKIDNQPSPVTITGLKPNTKVSGYQIAYAGASEKTTISDFTTLDKVPSAPTATLTAGSGKIDVTLVDGENTGSAITDRVVYWTDGTNNGTVDLKTSLTGSITGLTAGTEYTVQATVKNGAGESAKSAAVKATPTA
jgi:hypothetical protein